MGAVGLNESASRSAPDRDTAAVAGSGWSRWTPVNFVAITAHLAGAAMLTVGNRSRLVAQRGVGTAAAAKLALTVAALAATAYARLIGQRVIAHPEQPARTGTDPAPSTMPEVASAQRQLKVLQWVIPAITGALVVVSSHAGEQQRPENVLQGLRARARSRG